MIEQFNKPEISIDSYKGIAADIMELNELVAAGYIRVTDMRRDIVVTRGESKRTVEYDQLGFVRVGKFLQIPHFGQGEKTVEVSNKDGVWVIEIDDQTLRRVATEQVRTQKDFDDIFVSLFSEKLQTGLRHCLVQEKVLNAGQMDYMFMLSYAQLGLDIFFGAETLRHFATDSQPHDPLEIFAVFGTQVIVRGFMFQNILRWVIYFYDQKIYEMLNPDLEYRPSQDFLRLSLKEIVLPPVPFDRLVRGLTYLWVHGDEFIQTVDRPKPQTWVK